MPETLLANLQRHAQGPTNPFPCFLPSLASAAYGLRPVKRKCSVVTCLLSKEAKTAATSLIPLALKVS